MLDSAAGRRLGRAAFVVAAALSIHAMSCGGDDEGGGSGGSTTSASSGSPAATSGSGGAGTSTSGSGGSASTTSGSGGGQGGGTSADTWDNYAMGFFAKYCTECHGAGNAMRDYTTIDDVKTDSAEIRCGVASTKLSGCGDFPPPEQFPIDNATHDNDKPDIVERTRLVAWIEAGLPE